MGKITTELPKIYADGDNLFLKYPNEDYLISFKNLVVWSMTYDVGNDLSFADDIIRTKIFLEFSGEMNRQEVKGVDFELKKTFKEKGFYKNKIIGDKHVKRISFEKR